MLPSNDGLHREQLHTGVTNTLSFSICLEMITLLHNIYVYVFCVISIHLQMFWKYNKGNNIQRFLPVHISTCLPLYHLCKSKIY